MVRLHSNCVYHCHAGNVPERLKLGLSESWKSECSIDSDVDEVVLRTISHQLPNHLHHLLKTI